MSDLPSGTVTFLFTDIAGSTALWERDRAAMIAAVERHLSILRSLIAAHHGMLYKTVGDDTQSAFVSAEDALRAAVAAQRALLQETWPDPPGEVRVRMALHAGDAIPDERGHYLAAPLNRLSRLLAVGHGGQILLSQAVQQLARGGLPSGTELRDLGEHRLRDLLEPERIYQLRHQDLPQDFPPLTGLDARPNNLPRQPTPFLGRETQVQEIVALLQREDTQLLTLTGPGGTGKTRLALQAAAEAAETFPDGVYFVPLAALADPSLVPAAIATALGVREDGGRPVLEHLAAFLATKHLLLLIDNWEHLLAGAAILADLLQAAPGLTVLATSRAPLHLQAEREYPVPPLSLPQRKPPPTLEQLSQYEAVRLFIARAQAVKPGFSVDNANAPAVAEICHRLDGLPLAIELAAARLRLLPPQAMLTRLEQRLPLLTGGARDAPARQQTLRQTIAWSYDLLQPEEQTHFRRLAVFSGGFDFEAAGVVANPDGDADVLAGISALLDHSLVRQVEGVGGEPRFTMLETIREYAQERLAASDEKAPVEWCHSLHFLTLAERAKLMLVGPDQATWLARLDVEQDNLRAVLERAIEHEDAEVALRLGGSLWRFWAQRGHLSEGRTALERALAIEGNVDPSVRAAAIHFLGILALDLMEFAAAADHFMASLALQRRVDDQDGIARTSNGLGLVALYTGDYPSAAKRFDEALTIWSSIGYAVGVSVAQHNLGRLTAAEGNYALARSHHEQALALRRQLGNNGGVAYSLWALASVTLYEGNAAAAEHLFQEALTIFADLGDRQGEAYVLHGLARVSQRTSGDGETLQRFHDVLELRQSLGERNGVIECLEGIAAVLARQERTEPATRLLGAASSVRAAMSLVPAAAERLEVEETLALTRRALSCATVAQAWEAGQRLTLDQALAEALELTRENAIAAS